MKVYVYASSYDENSGGAIVLHRLCHIINNISGYSSYLIPRNCASNRRIWTRIKIKFSKFNTNPSWNTPIHRGKIIDDDSVVIYPEVINGNPIGAKNVVRWLLHQPGYFSGEIKYSNTELYFKFNSAINEFIFSGSLTSENHLKVVYYPIDIYQEDLSVQKDIDVCYMVRKGNYKQPIHDDNAICVDGLSHRQIANIFKRTKRFISYDDYTAYSIFASLCGCESIVVPDGKKTIEEWYPCISDRYGIAYGLEPEQLEWAKNTRYKVQEHIELEHEKVIERVKVCLLEMQEYFGLSKLSTKSVIT